MDSQLGAAFLEMNGVSFVLTWAIDAALLAATAVVVLRTGALPRWLGWRIAVLSPALLVLLLKMGRGLKTERKNGPCRLSKHSIRETRRKELAK
jgi:hypothetical protein